MRVALFISVVLLVAAKVASESEEVIEPHLRMIDRSPPVGNLRKLPPTASFGDADPNFDEAITFTVNTRGELGPSRAPLMCHCKVLAALVDDDESGRDQSSGRRVIQRRSYTAPELRAHVPLVTSEYAKTNTEVSFGVNVRGEEGPEFNPTWCSCMILKNNGQGENDDEEDEDAVANPRARLGQGRPSAAVPFHRHPVENIQTAEGVSPAIVAESTINIQLGEGSRRRGVSASLDPGSVVTEYYYRGRRIGRTGPEVSTQILTQMDEGREETPANATAVVDDSVAEPADDAVVQPDLEANITKSPDSFEPEITDVPTTAANSTAPTPLIVVDSDVSTTNATLVAANATATTATPDEDVDGSPLDVLKRLAVTHPRASAVLAETIQAIAAREQDHIRGLEEALAKRDIALKQLAMENEKTQAQLKYVLQMEQLRLMTDSPSTSPSASPSSSVSPSSSLPPSPSPSPSPSTELEWVPAKHHHHHTNRPSKKACYRDCRDVQCAPLFDSSLRQYAACMDNCALQCYGSSSH